MREKRYNWKARSVPIVKIDDSSKEKLAVDFSHRTEQYDCSNALVLPNKKRITKKEEKNSQKVKLLSKKERKRLEKVLERNQKKKERTELLEKLSEVAATKDEMQHYVSITSIQTRGLKTLKRKFPNYDRTKLIDEPEKEVLSNSISEENKKYKINAIRGAKKRKVDVTFVDTKKNYDPNVVGLEILDSGQESSNDDTEAESSSNFNIEEESEIIENDIKEKQLIEEKVENNIETEEFIEKSKSEEVSPDKKVICNEENVKPATFILLDRKPEIQAVRLKLPVVLEEQTIVETINDNSIVIITGETGSGKTTQVPQFLYESGYAKEKMIGITEPRRVAAISMSKRVAEEMNLTEKEVSYLIRFEGNVTPETKIKFMTDGVLLKEIEKDFLLSKYSVIILDEAHERSVYTDILIGFLSRIIPLRNKRNSPLKLIIMSATLRVEDFVENQKLFKIKPPVITVESRRFPVTVHFNKRTTDDYVNEALRKAVKIHTRLPEGGILIFLTGQREVNIVVQKLRRMFPIKKNNLKKEKKKSVIKTTQENDEMKNNDNSDDDFHLADNWKHNKQKRKTLLSDLPVINLDSYSEVPDDTYEDMMDADDEENMDVDESDNEEDEDIFEEFDTNNAEPMWVLPLYSLLSSNKQIEVFKPPPEGCRLCVVATNVAETSLTIPNVKYVIDSGRCKVRLYDKVTGVSTYRVSYTSKAAANQRAGRAGRTSSGHCYRLYSSAVFNDQFEEFSVPEIQRKPVDDIVLQLKAMNIHKVINFPFPTPPDIVQLKSAEKRLSILGALDPSKNSNEEDYSAKITRDGREMAKYPIAPRFGKMLLLSEKYGLMEYTICIVAALSVQEVLMETQVTHEETRNKWIQLRRRWAGTGNSLLLGDPMVLLTAIGAAEIANSKGKLEEFCEENGLRLKAVIEIRKLRLQLTNEINIRKPELNLQVNPRMSPPSEENAKLLRQIILAGMADRVAKKVPIENNDNRMGKIRTKYGYRTLDMEEYVFMDFKSVLRRTNPEWIVFGEIMENSSKKIIMSNITAVEPEWLRKYAKPLCNLTDPLADPPPRYDAETGRLMCHVAGTFGRGGWQLPEMEVEHPLTADGIRLFARFILDGTVCPKLKKFVPHLISTPSSIVKSWAKLIPRCEAITKVLMSQGVMSRDKLLNVWANDENFLLEPYKKWLPQSAHLKIIEIWPPM